MDRLEGSKEKMVGGEIKGQGEKLDYVGFWIFY